MDISLSFVVQKIRNTVAKINIQKFNPSRVVNGFLVVFIMFLLYNLAHATTPNPGHPWTEVGDGIWAATGQTALRTFTFPDATTTVLTTYTIDQGDLIYGSAASTTADLPKSTVATQYLSNTGTSNNPAWAYVNVANGVTGILGSSNGGTGNASTTFTGQTAARTYTLPDANSTILTTNAVVTLSQGGTGATIAASNGGIVYSNASTLALLAGTATAGQVLQSGSSAAPSWSTATYPSTAVTAGTELVSDGTNFISGTTTDPQVMVPYGLYAVNLTSVTNYATGVVNIEYMGVAQKDYTTCQVAQVVTTAVSGNTWSELAIYKGDLSWGNATTLTRLGYADVSTTYNSIGNKNTSISVTAKRGDHLWVGSGSSATTPFQVRALTGDLLATGAMLKLTGTQPSTASPVTPSVAATSTNGTWTAMQCN